MKVKDITRHGIKAEIHLASHGDWGKYKNQFHIKDGSGDCSLDFGFCKTLDEIEQKFNDRIDRWYQTIPHTDEEWLDKLSECMNWTGYEECHLVPEQVKRVLEMASKYYNPEEK